MDKAYQMKAREKKIFDRFILASGLTVGSVLKVR
jgi:hypothetical protein